ncbi:YebG family protein [Paraneptunicella aestuarii]|uniref:YebG family protein n=1 Tax=Paraneptunicella aestuarii TaxID=2831148 RepID=UPI001E6210CF|nr:YebG family protein [Paraneptunicella aestuarii]UAA37688.1 YebG family protein [Paraneptunicella aestuarii]
MAIITKYVVEHKGVEKLVTTDKKEADKYDKMLEVADNLAEYIQAKGIDLDEKLMEQLSVMLSKNKEVVAKLFKGVDAATVLKEETAEIVKLEKAKSAG